MSNELDFLDNLINEMEGDLPKSGGGGREFLPITYIPDGQFTIRLSSDLKGALYRHAHIYSARIAVPQGENGELKAKTLYAHVPEVDAISAIAKEIGDWRLNARHNFLYFIEVVKVTKSSNADFKPGASLAICDKKFHDALLALFKVTAEKGDGARAAIKEMLDPTKPGLLIDVVVTKGQQGTVKMSFDTFSQPYLIKPEVSEKFVDIKTAMYPEKGSTTDTANYTLILEHYKKLLEEHRQRQASKVHTPPATSAMPTAQVPAVESAPQVQAPAEVPAQAPTESAPATSAADQLAAMLNG